MSAWLAFLALCALVAVLIPFPHLLPWSMAGIAALWLVTPARGRR